jgi:hypothetical protein
MAALPGWFWLDRAAREHYPESEYAARGLM